MMVERAGNQLTWPTTALSKSVTFAILAQFDAQTRNIVLYGWYYFVKSTNHHLVVHEMPH